MTVSDSIVPSRARLRQCKAIFAAGGDLMLPAPFLPQKSAGYAVPSRFEPRVARIAQHLEHETVQIANSALEVEIGQNDRAYHAAVEINRDELRHTYWIDGLK